MTENNHDNVLLRSVPLNLTGNLSLSQTDDLLQLAAQSFAKQVFASFMNVRPDLISCNGPVPPRNHSRQKTGIPFTKQEMKKMPLKYRKIFAHGNMIVPYRLRKDGVYEARIRRKNLHIEVSARDFESLKEKFILALQKSERGPEKKDISQTNFAEFACKWLEVKRLSSNLPLSKNTTDWYRKTSFRLSAMLLLRTSTGTGCKIICSDLSGTANIGRRKNFPIFCAVSSTSPPTISASLLPWQKSFCPAIRPKREMRFPMRKKPGSSAIASTIPTPPLRTPFSPFCISECDKASFRPSKWSTAHGWKRKRAKNAWVRMSSYVGLRSLRWYEKFCLTSILQRQKPPIPGQSPRRSNGYCPIITSMSSGIPISAVARNAASREKWSACGSVTACLAPSLPPYIPITLRNFKCGKRKRSYTPLPV